MENKNKSWVKWIYWFTFAVAVILVYKTLDSFSEITNFIQRLFNILMPFVIAVLLAYIFYIPSRKMESIFKKSKFKLISKRARGLGILTVYVIAIILCAIVIKFVLPSISESITDLFNNLPTYYSNALDTIENADEDSILNKINAAEIIKDLQDIDFSQIFSMETITQYAKGVINIATGIFDFFVSIIVSVYILLERGEIIKFGKNLSSALFKHKTYKNLGTYFRKTNTIFFKFLSSQLIDSVLVGIIISIALLIMKVKYAVLLGFLIGLFNMIPYLGAIIAITIAILITLLTGGFGQAIWLAIVVIIIQQIDANVINPKITGSSLEISPILVIFSVTIGGAYFGILGMFLAVPICTVIKTFLIDYIRYKNRLKEEVE